jgi:hypothetical protein
VPLTLGDDELGEDSVDLLDGVPSCGEEGIELGGARLRGGLILLAEGLDGVDEQLAMRYVGAHPRFNL